VAPPSATATSPKKKTKEPVVTTGDTTDDDEEVASSQLDDAVAAAAAATVKKEKKPTYVGHKRTAEEKKTFANLRVFGTFLSVPFALEPAFIEYILRQLTPPNKTAAPEDLIKRDSMLGVHLIDKLRYNKPAFVIASQWLMGFRAEQKQKASASKESEPCLVQQVTTAAAVATVSTAAAASTAGVIPSHLPPAEEEEEKDRNLRTMSISELTDYATTCLKRSHSAMEEAGRAQFEMKIRKGNLTVDDSGGGGADDRPLTEAEKKLLKEKFIDQSITLSKSDPEQTRQVQLIIGGENTSRYKKAQAFVNASVSGRPKKKTRY
jgi:hypothetical protein